MNLHGWTCLAEAKRAKQLLIGIITKYTSLERERQRERERERERLYVVNVFALLCFNLSSFALLLLPSICVGFMRRCLKGVWKIYVFANGLKLGFETGV